MDFSQRKSSLNNSSQRCSSSKNRRHISASYSSHQSDSSDDDDSPLAKRHPIVSHNYPHHTHDVYPMSPSTHGEVVVKIDGSTTLNNTRSVCQDGHSSYWRGSSEDFSFPRPAGESKDDNRRDGIGSGGSPHGVHDPTTKLISQFLEQQKAKGEMSLDMDVDMEELQHHHYDQNKIPRQLRQGGLPPLPPDSNSTPINNNANVNHDGSKETRVSFHESLTSDIARRPSSLYNNAHDDSSSRTSSMSGDDENNHSAEIRRSPSSRTNKSASFRRMASMSLCKTKSRLMDPPSTPIDQRSGAIHKSGQLYMRSGIIGKSSVIDEDEDDTFLEDEFPDDFTSTNISCLVILEWIGLVLIMGFLICSLIIPVMRIMTLWNMKLWKWLVLFLVLICGRLVSNWGIRIVVFLIERNFLLRKRVLYFVYGLKKAVQNVIWLGLVLITWLFLFDERVLMESKSEQLRIVTKLLIIGEVGAILWLLKTLLVKVLASNFHVKAFFDRIQESLFNQFVIETLSAPPLFEFHQAQEEEDVQSPQHAGVSMPLDHPTTVFARNKSGKSSIVQRTSHNRKNQGANATPYRSPIGQSTRFSESHSKKHDEGITVDRLHKLNQKNVSAWNMKRLMKIIRHGSLTTLDEHIVDVTTQDDESSTQIRSEVEAKAAARNIFRNVGKPHSKFIYLDDILRFMREDEALRTMGLFEGAIENEKISKKALKNWVVNAFRERRALALTLYDTKTAVNKLHKMVNVLVSIIIIIFGFIFLNIITSQNLLFLSSQVVVVAFVFGNTCKNVFESIIFLFVIHPFDVGDRCEIDTIQMVVEEINILTTVFLRYDNQKIVFPNYILLTKPIHNYYRSPDMGDGIELCFHIATPAEKIAVIRQRITSYIENKKEHWYPSPMVILKDTDGLNMLRIAVWLQHRMNHQDMGERWVRRALLIEECVKILREMDIEYRVYPMNVNITSIPPLNHAHVPPASSSF